MRSPAAPGAVERYARRVAELDPAHLEALGAARRAFRRAARAGEPPPPVALPVTVTDEPGAMAFMHAVLDLRVPDRRLAEILRRSAPGPVRERLRNALEARPLWLAAARDALLPRAVVLRLAEGHAGTPRESATAARAQASRVLARLGERYAALIPPVGDPGSGAAPSLSPVPPVSPPLAPHPVGRGLLIAMAGLLLILLWNEQSDFLAKRRDRGEEPATGAPPASKRRPGGLGEILQDVLERRRAAGERPAVPPPSPPTEAPAPDEPPTSEPPASKEPAPAPPAAQDPPAAR